MTPYKRPKIFQATRSKLGKNFGGLVVKHRLIFERILSQPARYGRSYLEYILESKNRGCCHYVRASLPNGLYAENKIRRTDSLLVTCEDEDGKSFGFQKLPRNGFYIGHFLHGYRDGTGKFDINLGYVYEGDFKASRFHGYGRMNSKMTPADNYEGTFIEGRFVGDPRGPGKVNKFSVKRFFGLSKN